MKFGIFLFSTFTNLIAAQSLGIGNSSFSETGFYIRDIHTDWSPYSLENDIKFSFDLSNLNFDFKNLRVQYDDAEDQDFINIHIVGPNLQLKQMKLSFETFGKDWIRLEKLKRLAKKEDIPKNSLNVLANASEIFFEDNQRYPLSFNELAINNYIDPQVYPLNEQSWIYSLELPDKITAKTTVYSNLPDHQIIIYDWSSKIIIGSLIPAELKNITDIHWKFSISLDEIIEKISSKWNIRYSADSTFIDFYQNYGKFNINDFRISAIPDRNLENKMSIKIPTFSIELNNFAMNFTLDKSKPIIHQGKGKVSIRNFDIKVPENLSRVSEIESILEQLGIWNNAIKIRLIELSLSIINDHTGEIQFLLNTPFIKVNVNGDFAISHNNNYPEILLHNVAIEIYPISLGVRTWIRAWELNNDRNLNRRGGTILLKMEGPLNNPVIHGY